ncbi:MAG: flippase-like domain-containing protein [Bacteroidota bacterium]|nr:flippase-like domain-containing protein [Bacteroidota bacterium]
MKKNSLTILKFLFFLSIGVLLIWLVIKDKTDEEISNITQSLRRADYSWILLSVVISAVSHYLRALRWKILLEPLNHFPKTSTTFFAVMVGYLANCAVPRLGEVTRCGILTRYSKVPFIQGFGSVIGERALDVICLILIFFLMLALEFSRISGIADQLIFSFFSGKADLLVQNRTVLIIGIITLLLMAGIIYYFRKKISALLSGKVKGFLKGLWDGLKSIKDVHKPRTFILYTILIWLMYILQVYVCFFALAETSHLSFGVAVVITVFGSIGIAVVPGGTGAYQYIVILILTSVYLIAEPPAFAFAWSVWASQISLILVLGLVSLILLPLMNKEIPASVPDKK